MVDCDDIKFEEEAEGLLHMTGWHHDGTAECWWYTVNDVKKFEEKYFIDYEGDIAKYDENVSEAIKMGDIFSVKGYGKFCVSDCGRINKKGKIVVQVKKYV